MQHPVWFCALFFTLCFNLIQKERIFWPSPLIDLLLYRLFDFFFLLLQFFRLNGMFNSIDNVMEKRSLQRWSNFRNELLQKWPFKRPFFVLFTSTCGTSISTEYLDLKINFKSSQNFKVISLFLSFFFQIQWKKAKSKFTQSFTNEKYKNSELKYSK